MTVYQNPVTLFDVHVDLLNDDKNLINGCDSVVLPVMIVERDPSVVEFFRVITETYFVRYKPVTAGGMLSRLLKIENSNNFQIMHLLNDAEFLHQSSCWPLTGNKNVADEIAMQSFNGDWVFDFFPILMWTTLSLTEQAEEFSFMLEVCR